jgi:gliding motility-associated-like protein
MNKIVIGIGFIILSLIGKVEGQGFSEIVGITLPVSGNSVLCAGDLNNDGLMDIIMGGQDVTQNFAKAFQNSGDSTFLDMGIGLPSLTSYAIEISDLNNDGWQDILLSGVNASNIPMFYIYINQQNGVFNTISHSIPGLRYGCIKTGDLNLDGNNDIFVLGLVSDGNYTAIYKNNGDLTFTKDSYNFTGVYDGGAVLTDLNNDGLLDIFYAGLNSSYVEESFMFINSGEWNFTERVSDILGIRGGKIETADINNDGYIDIAISGKDKDDNYKMNIYKNIVGSSFPIHSSLTGVINGSFKFGDYNADGFPDIITTGKDQLDNYTSVLYDNNSGTSFTSNGISLTGLSNSACLWFDFNNDNKLDFLLSGYKLTGPTVELYSNDELNSNQQPNYPTNLIAQTDSNNVLFSWQNGTDNEQESKGLSYDVWLVDNASSNFVLRAPSDTLNGIRKIIKQGALEDTSFNTELPEGKYYWSVQSVDQSFKGSSFAPKETFNIVYPIFIGEDTTLCFNEHIILSVDDYSGTAKWYSKKNPTVSFSSDKVVDVIANETDTIWVDLLKSYGSVISDTIIINVNSLPEVNLGSDKSICPNSELELTMGTVDDIVNWSTLSGEFSATDIRIFKNNYSTTEEIYVELIDINGCKNTDTIKVVMNVVPEIDLTNDTAICKFNTIHLSVTNTDSINWYTISNDLLLANNNNIDVYIDDNKTIRIEAVSDFGCLNSDTIEIVARNLPIAEAGGDELICDGYSVIIGPDDANTNYSYLWSPNQNIDNINIANPLVAPQTDTKYYLNIIDQFGCEADDSVLVQINPKGTINIGEDTSICPGEEVVIGGNPTATGSILPYSYVWSPTESLGGYTTANPIAAPKTTTTYSVIVYTGDCPVDTLETTVTVNPLPEIEIMNDTLIGFEEDINLWARGGVSYLWAPKDYIDNPDLQEPIANLQQTTHFVVQVTNEYGCTDTAGVNILIKNEIFVPELFTPNNDGNNDYFKVYGFGIKQLELTIYNKFGEIVFKSNDLNEILNIGWDGKSNGNYLEEGSYFWRADGEFFNGEKALFKGKNVGVITVLR